MVGQIGLLATPVTGVAGVDGDSDAVTPGGDEVVATDGPLLPAAQPEIINPARMHPRPSRPAGVIARKVHRGDGTRKGSRAHPGRPRRPCPIRHDGGVSAGRLTFVERDGTVVRYVEVADELSQIRVAWPTLEEAVGSLRGRRFLAAFDPGQGWYRACVELQEDVSAAERELPQATIPGGGFARIRLRGDPPGVYDEIAPAYALLEASATRDDGRPSLEHYRRMDEIDVLMPVI
jgi:hypothetical protein